MNLLTPDFLQAKFFMRNESQDGIDDLPRIAPHQIHGAEIIHADDDSFAEYSLPNRPEADGIMLTTTRASASLRFADCAPVMIWGKFWVMILHSGYKGTVLNISSRGLEFVRSLKGDDAVNKACAWIGPCIGREHYCRDIGDEWTEKGRAVFHAENFDERGSKIYFDLAGEIRNQLLDSGVKDENITLSGIDTCTDSRCYSYRRGYKEDRMMLYARLLRVN
ncbi:MAG: polyphenol oxidase family protein [Synergistaceae bacterium]|nr:polyphenol oxidase family protein [Synergistaceae bacterium]